MASFWYEISSSPHDALLIAQGQPTVYSSPLCLSFCPSVCRHACVFLCTVFRKGQAVYPMDAGFVRGPTLYVQQTPPRPLTPVVTLLVVTTLVFVCSVCVFMCVCVFVFWLTAERPLGGNVFQFLPWFVCFWNLVFGICCCCCCWRPIIQPLGFDTHELCISSSSKLQEEALGHLVGDWNYLYWCTPLMLKWFRLLCYYSDIQNCIKRYPFFIFFFIFKKVPHQLIHQRKCAFIFWLPPATLQNTPRGIRTVI